MQASDVAVDDVIEKGIVSDPSRRPSRRLSSRPSNVVIVGLVAIVVAFVGIGALHALQQPPFWPTDETAHVGYAQEIASGRLPQIREFPEVPVDARQWQAERSMANDIRYRGVWVANHPPLHYIAVAPLTMLSRAADAPDAGLILMRFANVAFAAVGVVFTFLLASELTRRNHRLALLAAALAALVPQGHAVFSQGLNDGLGFAAGTAVVWAGARCIRRIDALTRRDLALLAVTAAVGFGSRAATMLLAVAVVGVVALRRFTRPAASAGEQGRRAAHLVLIGLGPAVVVFGWFYVRNMVLYGDLGASQYLLEMFRRERRGSVFDMIVRWSMWSNVYEGLMSPTTRRRIVPPGSLVITLIAAVGVGSAFVAGRISRGGEFPTDAGAPADDRIAAAHTLRWQLSLGLLTVGLIALTIAQHASGGGNAHARYAMPAIGVAAVLAVIGMERVRSRWAPLALVAIAGWWALVNLPVDIDPGTMIRNRDDGQLAPYPLRVLPLSDGWRTAAGALIVVGVVVAAGALLAMLRSPARQTPEPHNLGPTAPRQHGDGELVDV
ncbi:MAG TPA: glycosyltransferase family 39 protein [Ilumatobacteraceae bacterium]|nr:glycosyltransferase family 39 protein [Ilumatobacteraceae bacterium]